MAEYRWSSVEFSGGLPRLWVRPAKSKPGEPTGLRVSFDSVEDVRRLVSTLRGALSLIDTDRKGAKHGRRTGRR